MEFVLAAPVLSARFRFAFARRPHGGGDRLPIRRLLAKLGFGLAVGLPFVELGDVFANGAFAAAFSQWHGEFPPSLLNF
jgi:hypothetical protein